MGKKNKKKDITGVVYSTNQNYDYSYDDEQEEETLPPNEQDLRIVLDRKKGASLPFLSTKTDSKFLYFEGSSTSNLTSRSPLKPCLRLM